MCAGISFLVNKMSLEAAETAVRQNFHHFIKIHFLFT